MNEESKENLYSEEDLDATRNISLVARDGDHALPDACFACVPDEARGPSGNKSRRSVKLCSPEGALSPSFVLAATAAVELVAAGSDAVARVRGAYRRVFPDRSLPLSVAMSEEEEAEYWFAEVAPDGSQLMVGLYLPQEVASELVVAGGQSAQSLHITLALIDWTDKTALDLARVVATVDREVKYYEPVSGTISGYGRFNAPDPTVDDAMDVFYASIDAPGLVSMRQSLVYCLADCGYCPCMEHDFNPHITLKYLEPGADNPVESIPSLDVVFNMTSVNVGDYRVDIPFYTSESMSYSEGSDVARPTQIRALFAELQSEWIPYLPIPGHYYHRQFGNLDLTKARYDRILSNFNNNTYGQDLPISAEHDSKAVGAVGWIRAGGMRLAADGSIEVKPDWNERGSALIEDNRFQYVSAEFFTQWQDPVTGIWHEDVAVGHTICVRPHFKTNVLQPLAASEDAALAVFRAAQESGAVSMHEAQVAPIEGADKMPDDENKEKEEEGKSPPVQASESAPAAPAKPVRVTLNDEGLLDVLSFAEEKQRLLSQVQLAESRARAADQRALDAESRATRVEKERLREWAAAEVLGRSEDNGLRWLGDAEKHIDMLVSQAQQFGRESTQVTYIVDEQRAKRRAIERSGIFREVGHSIVHGTGETIGEAELLAKQLMEKNQDLTAEAAMSKVFSENPEMYDRYVNSPQGQQVQIGAPAGVV